MRDVKKIDEDLRAALKSGNADLLRTLRMLKTAIRNKEVELIKTLEEKDYFQVVNCLAKQGRESIEQFEKAGRTDLVEPEKRELEILLSYLPPAMSEEDVIRIIEESIKETGVVGPKEMGKVMKVVMAKVAGRADGKLVSALVAKKLQSF